MLVHNQINQSMKQWLHLPRAYLWQQLADVQLAVEVEGAVGEQVQRGGATREVGAPPPVVVLTAGGQQQQQQQQSGSDV